MLLLLMLPLNDGPMCWTPPPSPVDRLPAIQLWSIRYPSAPALTVIPPAPAGVPENSASPIDALLQSMLWWMCPPVLNWNGIAPFNAMLPNVLLIGGQATTAGVTPHSTPSLR